MSGRYGAAGVSWTLIVSDATCCCLTSHMFSDPPDNVDDLFSCYDSVLRQLVDKHAPMRSVVIGQRPQSPWYDGECREMKRTTRRLERVYRKTHVNSDYKAWKTQLNNQRSFYQTKYNIYWSSIVAECRGDCKQLHVDQTEVAVERSSCVPATRRQR